MFLQTMLNEYELLLLVREGGDETQSSCVHLFLQFIAIKKVEVSAHAAKEQNRITNPMTRILMISSFL